MPKTMMSSGVMSEPPPMPVVPTRKPTPRPKTTIRRSMSGKVQPALGLALPGPAAGPPVAGQRAVRAPDRGVAALVQRVDRQAPLVHVGPDVLVRPVRERARLEQAVGGVPAELGRAGPGRRLVPAHAGDPAVEPGERA